MGASPATARYLPFSDQRTDAWQLKPLPSLGEAGVVRLDTEGTGLHRFKDRPVGIAIGYGDRFEYHPFGHRGGGPQHDEETVKRWARAELRGKIIEGLHIKHDAHQLISWGVDLREHNTLHDVGHSEGLLDDHEKRFNLNHLTQKRLGLTKHDVGPGASIADQPSSAIGAYAERDVELVKLLSDYYAPRLRAEGLETVSRLEDDVLPAVIEMERNGVPLDLDTLQSWEASSKALVERLAWDLYRMVGFTVNPDATTDLVRLWKACGEPVTHRTAAGAPSFTADIVQDAATRHPAIQLVWRIGKLNDLRSKYLVKYLHDAEDGVIYPSFNQMMTDEGGTVSGRMSCVKPNMQQVLGASKHKRLYGWLAEYGVDYAIKGVCVPRHGTWVSADMRQQEFRLFVHYANSRRLLEYYERDPLTNFHKVVEGFVLPFKPDIDPVRVKVVSFTSVYGGGAGSLAASLNIDHADAEELSDTYHQAFPEVKRLLYQCSDVANSRGYVKSALGRRSRFLGQAGRRERTHKALNAVIQSSGADVTKLNLVASYRERKALGLTLRLSVHDSQEADLSDPSKLPQYEDLLNTQKAAFRVPLLWEVKSGASWASAK